MRFVRMELNNWRSFLGLHQIEFAGWDSCNVTVLVGQNGAGKTALLNAFTWVLFGETTAGFRRPDDLFNHTALSLIKVGTVDKMFVKICFDHEGEQYVVTRSISAERAHNHEPPTVGPTKFSATVRNKTGVTEAVDQEKINAVLPPGLHPFFFFPAENIGKDIDQNDAASIRASMSRAIDVLLDIERYDNALKIISKTLTKHLKTPKNTPKDATIMAAEEEMNDARERWESTEQRKKKLPGIIEKAQRAVDKLNQALEESDAHRGAVEEMNKVKDEIYRENDNIERIRDGQVLAINSACGIVFGKEIFVDAKAALDVAHKEGKIPPKVSSGLLDELIDVRQKCICGRELGKCELGELKSLRSITLEDSIAEIASDLRGRLPLLIETDDGSVDKSVANEILELDKEANDAERRLLALKQRLKKLIDDQPEISHGDPGKTREAWQQQEKRLLRLQEELTDISKELPDLELAKRNAEKKYGAALNRQTKTKAIGEARGLLTSVEETLSKIQEIVRTCARKDVERAMNDFYTPLLLKNYCVRLTDDFRYEIVDESTSRTVGASSSEVALATFAFVGAIAALMPSYARLERLLPAGDGKSVGSLRADKANAYPVVLDAPYSPFGKEYGDQFSKVLPDLLPQSVLIVREDQLEYINSMIDDTRVGSAYVLQLQTGSAESKELVWQNKKYGYVINIEGQVASHTKITPLPVG
ncbi:hypothetical protein D3OALGA1CA_5063 [Olavius algarvensis associated proteobacterium Delta 3]|nr:hypothetical protein D3OALGA1CA_5063 [Olavius algarvensis associated proteobacterium Delta 3]